MTIEDFFMNPSRRKFLAVAGAAPLVLFASGAVRAQTACFDPAALPLAQKNRRRGLGYVEPSPDPKKHCGRCAFFAAAKTGCGTCQMLGGGPVSVVGVCNSYAPKP
jgi:hypothetical protein